MSKRDLRDHRIPFPSADASRERTFTKEEGARGIFEGVARVSTSKIVFLVTLQRGLQTVLHSRKEYKW